jgi:hypothetical protein
MSLAEHKEGVKIHFNHKCNGIDFNSGTVSFSTPSGEVIEVVFIRIGSLLQAG